MSLQIDNYTLSLILSGRAQELGFDSFSPADWDLLMHNAQAEGVAPLVHWELSRSEKILFAPKSVQNSMRAMYFSVRMNNQAIIKELEILTRHFDTAAIPVVVLKGASFVLTIYPDIGLRPMADLDLLVPASKLSEAVQIAKTLEYVDVVPEAFPGLRDLLGDEICLQKTGMPFIMLELHNSLLVDKSFTYAVPVEWFWEQTEPIEGLSSDRRINNLRLLTPTAQVLYASAHAMLKHGGRDTSLRWYYDLDRLIRFYADRMDWNLLLLQAKTFQWGTALNAALFQTYNYFGTPIPDHVLAELPEINDRHRNLIALKQIKPSTRVFEEYQHLMARKWYGRLILILGLIMPGPAYMRWRYGLKTYWALPAWYLYRWWGILKDAIMTVLLLVRKVLHQAGHRNRSRQIS
jgi:hypothetical protein